ncbi:TonB-dependent receptor [Zhouia amylolytica]|uniref:TonB-dependent receptor plug n=1 Tax=Zhouia amylolytica AD3 TaxID=1286632 RepID=W2UQX7_9FLAO|nr:TonB-dependent receptor [Zhouia amylolytica]ETN95727.1 tonB-dependent receptor plug [Zhouia amylolytica AD3]
MIDLRTRHIHIVILLLFSISYTFAQQAKGTLTGYVTDMLGYPLEGATVVIQGTSQGTVTNQNGKYSLENLQPGSYQVTASFLGYKSETIYNVVVKSVGTVPLNFSLMTQEETLEAVIVQKQPTSRPKETPLSYQQLSAVEIATYPGGNNDVVRVAQSFPGVSPSVGGFRNDLIIRGGAPNETVYYLDGVEIPNINHFSTQGSSGGPVGMLNVSFIEDVNLATSSFGAVYDNPLSGVLQFNQRDGNRKDFRGNFRLSASDAALTVEGPLFKGRNEESNTSFMLSVRRSYLQFLFKFIGLPIRPDYWDYQYKLTHRIGDYDEINILGLGSIDDFSLESPEDFDEEQQATFEQTPFIEQQTNTIGISWKHRFKNSKGYIRTVLSNNTLENNFTRYEDNETQSNPFFINDSKEAETKLRFSYNKFFDGWKLEGGINTQLSNYKNSTVDLKNDAAYITEIDFFKYGYYANVTKSFLEGRIDLSAGFRMDDDSFTSENNLLNTFSPRMAVSYEFMPSWKLNATVGRYFKLPPYTILGFRNNDSELINKNVNYTRSDHYVIGIEKILSGSSSIAVEAFYKKYADYPVSVRDSVSLANKGGGFEVLGNEPVKSVGKGRSYGAELMFQQKLTKNFYGIFSYTYFFSEFTGFDESQYLPSVWDSRHLISFTGGYQLPKLWEVSTRYRFSGKTPFVPIDIQSSTASYPDLIYDYNRLGEEKLKSFSQLDIRIDKKWNFKKISLDLFFEVQNVLAEDLPQPPEYGLARDESGQPLTPRTLTEITTDSGTIIPVIGLVLDF